MRRNKAIMFNLLVLLCGTLLLVSHAAAQGVEPTPPDPSTRFVEPCINFDRGPGPLKCGICMMRALYSDS